MDRAIFIVFYDNFWAKFFDNYSCCGCCIKCGHWHCLFDVDGRNELYRLSDWSGWTPQRRRCACGISRKIDRLFWLWLWQFLISLGPILVVGIPAFFLFFQDSQAMLLGMMNNSTIPMMSLLMLIVIVILAMIAWLAPTLLLFHDITAGQAIKLSIKGCIKNILPFCGTALFWAYWWLGQWFRLGLGF